MPIAVKILPNVAYLESIFRYEESTGFLFWKRINSNRINSTIPAGYSKGNGRHLYISIDGESYLVHRIIWKMYYKEEPPSEIDHCDRDASNNKINNLRKAIRSQNKANENVRANNTSGYKGVSWHKRANKWRAYLMFNCIEIHIGYFNTKEEAALARKAYAEKVWKEYANESDKLRLTRKIKKIVRKVNNDVYSE